MKVSQISRIISMMGGYEGGERFGEGREKRWKGGGEEMRLFWGGE